MPFHKSHIAFERTAGFSKIFTDYINNSSSLSPFYKYAPLLDSFEEAIKDISRTSFNRDKLSEVLRKQYEHISDENSSPYVLSNINSIKDPSTFTVCTGHQLCIFTGPLYFIYKIITTIKLASTLKQKYPQYNFVPIYWMASEDHDFEEVNHIHLSNEKLEWKSEELEGSKHIAVGKIKVKSLSRIIDELKKHLGESENAKHLIKLFSEAYSGNKTLSQATRHIVARLFSDQGLIVLDGDDADLKREITDIIKDDLFNNANFKLVNDTIELLHEKGYDNQVNPREINCFYLQDTQRRRIVKSTLGFKVLDTTLEFTNEQMQAEIEMHPERFSPNVVLRPLYQQKILPNIAYVGGPGELSYWLEYKKMFDAHNVIFPVLIPRNSVMWLDEKQNRQLQKLEIEDHDIFKSEDELIKLTVNKKASRAISLDLYRQQIKDIYDEIMHEAASVDSTLKANVEARLQKTLASVTNIEAKMLRAEKNKQKIMVNQIKKIKANLFPGGILQERHDNFIPYYLKYGKDFFNTLNQAFDPFDFRFILLKEK